MAVNIDKILKKKGWTGAELGRLELVTTLDVFKQNMEGVADPKQIISREDLKKMLSTLNAAEGRVYNGYLAIHEWFIRTFSTSIAYEQQSYLNLNILTNVVGNAISAEDIYRYIASLPVIMTQKEYDDTKASRKQEFFRYTDEHEGGINFFSLVGMAIEHYVVQLDKAPSKKNPLKPLKKKLEREKVTDPHILTAYNKTWGNGYYTLEDGTRSDEVDPDEWRRLIMPVIADIEKELGENLNEEEQEGVEDYIEDVVNRIMDREAIHYRDMAIYNGASLEEADRIQEEADIKSGFTRRCTWHYYEAPPEGLTKWDIVEQGELGSYYPAMDEATPNETDVTEEAQALLAEFPTLVAAILKDMERYIPGARSIPAEKWATTVYSAEDVYNMGYYDFKDLVDSDDTTFDGINRAANGIAILRPHDNCNSSRIDAKTGYYSPPSVQQTLTNLSLEAYFPDNENYADNVEELESARQLLAESYYFLKGYNYSLDLIAQFYDLDEILIAKRNLELLEERITAFNNLVFNLYGRIQREDYDDEELQRRKLGVLKDILYPVSLEDLEIPEEAIAKAKADLKDFKAFRDDASDLSLTLCYREGA